MNINRALNHVLYNGAAQPADVTWQRWGAMLRFIKRNHKNIWNNRNQPIYKNQAKT